MAVATRLVDHSDDGTGLEAMLAFDPEAGPRPAVIIFHSFVGRGENEAAAALRLAEMGYAGFAADLYGKGVRGTTPEESAALMKPFMDDRALLRRRMLHILDTVRGLAEVDTARIAAIGFCFGGLCALDLARSGADICGVASFHGLLTPPPAALADNAIRSKLLVFHGWDDPLAPPADVVALGRELTAAGADWQIHAYGGTMHSFTNPKAAAAESGFLYNPAATARAWRSLEAYLNEIFA